MAPKIPQPTFLWPPKRRSTRLDDVEIDGRSSLPQVRGPLTISKQQCAGVQTSTFGGYIHSISLSPTSPRIAIAYGNEIALTDVIPNPYRLKDSGEHLPKPPAFPHNKSVGHIAKSLQFTRKDHLVVTYTGQGIVYVPVRLSELRRSFLVLAFGNPTRLKSSERSSRGRSRCECCKVCT